MKSIKRSYWRKFMALLITTFLMLLAVSCTAQTAQEPEEPEEP